RGTELAWTILAPSRLTLEEPTGRIALGAAEAGEVSRGNVARTIAAALAQPGTTGRFLAFNDGEQDSADALGAVSGRAPASAQERRRARPQRAAGDVRRPTSYGAPSPE